MFLASKPNSLVSTRTKSVVISEIAKKARSDPTLLPALLVLPVARLCRRARQRLLEHSVDVPIAAKSGISGRTRSSVLPCKTRTSKIRHLMMRPLEARAVQRAPRGVPWRARRPSKLPLWSMIQLLTFRKAYMYARAPVLVSQPFRE
jgi:hypothetical protein